MYSQYWLVAVLVTLIVSALAAFSVKEVLGGRHVSARVQKQGASPLLGYYPMEFAYWILAPIGRLATALKLSPNIFSWSCLILGIAAAVAAGLGSIALAGGLSIVSGLLDALDGMVARSRGVASDAGEVLDAAVDRYTEFFFLGGLCIYYRFEPWAMVLVLAALLGSLMVSYSQAKGEAMACVIPKGMMRRPERAVYLGGGALLSPWVGSWFEVRGIADPAMNYLLLLAIMIVAAFSNATAIHRYVSMYEQLRSRERAKQIEKNSGSVS